MKSMKPVGHSSRLPLKTIKKEIVDDFKIHIKYNQEKKEFRCDIFNDDKKYRSVAFSLRSKYPEAIVQDTLGEIRTNHFFKSFGTKKQHYIRKQLQLLLDRGFTN